MATEPTLAQKTSAPVPRRFITGLGIGQIISWGTLYYSFPLIAERMGADLGLDKPAVYGAATVGLLIASLSAYPIGLAIDRGHGRAVMSLGSALSGVLLLAWSLVRDLWVLYPLLAGIGLAQAMTLYEPAFAVIARRYGADVRAGITALTLWGGFASTVFVPLIEWLIRWVDWRSALIVLGLLNLTVCVAVHLLVIPRRTAGAADPRPAPVSSSIRSTEWRSVRWVLGQRTFWGLLIAFTLYAAAFSGFGYHLYPLLIERGFDPATVVGAIAIIGPSQVLGRILIWRFAERAPVRVIGQTAVWVLPVALGLLVWLPRTFLALAVFAVLYGAANGVLTIVRGLAVPEMLTREAYGVVNSLLGVPGTIARSLAPFVVALAWAAVGSYGPILAAILFSSLVVSVSFWLASTGAGSNRDGRAEPLVEQVEA